jgi:hypothetical protein
MAVFPGKKTASLLFVSRAHAGGASVFLLELTRVFVYPRPPLTSAPKGEPHADWRNKRNSRR